MKVLPLDDFFFRSLVRFMWLVYPSCTMQLFLRSAKSVCWKKAIESTHNSLPTPVIASLVNVIMHPELST